jgi:hypothetical protein
VNERKDAKRMLEYLDSPSYIINNEKKVMGLKASGYKL